jgi:Spy/CpxP family protein refolding chaperone
MKNTMMTACFLTGMFMLSPLAVSAQPADSTVPRPFQKMITELKLTPDQQAKLQAQHKEMREQGKMIFEQMKKIREKVKTELLKDKPSPAALDDYAAQLAGLHRQLIQKRHEHLLQAKKILTPEQFSKLVNHEWKRQGTEGCGPFPGKGKGKHGPETGDEDMDDR